MLFESIYSSKYSVPEQKIVTHHNYKYCYQITQNPHNIYFFQDYVVRISAIYISIVFFINIRNIYENILIMDQRKLCQKM